MKSIKNKSLDYGGGTAPEAFLRKAGIFSVQDPLIEGIILTVSTPGGSLAKARDIFSRVGRSGRRGLTGSIKLYNYLSLFLTALRIISLTAVHYLCYSMLFWLPGYIHTCTDKETQALKRDSFPAVLPFCRPLNRWE